MTRCTRPPQTVSSHFEALSKAAVAKAQNKAAPRRPPLSKAVKTPAGIRPLVNPRQTAAARGRVAQLSFAGREKRTRNPHTSNRSRAARRISILARCSSSLTFAGNFVVRTLLNASALPHLHRLAPRPRIRAGIVVWGYVHTDDIGAALGASVRRRPDKPRQLLPLGTGKAPTPSPEKVKRAVQECYASMVHTHARTP